DEHTSVPDVLLVSTTLWNDLSPDQQRWLQDAADESSVYQMKLWQESTADSLRALEEAGVEIIHPDTSLFAERVQPLHDTFRQDPELRVLMDRIRALGPGAATD